MSWPIITLALVAAITFSIEGSEISQKSIGEKLAPPSEMFHRVQDAYASLSSYSDEGKTVSTVNGGMTLTMTFTTKLARPDLYRIEWEQRTTFIAKGGVVWSAGHGDFIILGNSVARKEANRKLALASATGVSFGAAATIPLTFFKVDFPGSLLNSKNEKQQADEKLGTVECYVFSNELTNGTTRTLWIGKKDLLIHQLKTVTSSEGMQAALDQAAKITGTLQGNSPGGVSQIETHFNIASNKQFSPQEFER
jgi:outer membrane lipoprotein-sorting protein